MPDLPPPVTELCTGRAAERAALISSVDDGVRGDGRGVVLLGPAGIGKSTVFRSLAVTARLRHPALRVVRVDGAESEAQLPLASLSLLTWRLGQLVPGSSGDVAALAALLEAGPTDDRVLENAVLHALAEAVHESPLLLLLDDAQWVDPVSARVLVYACRRLDQDGLITIVASRDDQPSAFREAGFESLALGGIDLDHSSGLLDLHLGSGVVDPAVARSCWRRTGGNPLAMLEAMRSIDDEQRRGLRPLPDVLPVGPRVIEHMADRIRHLDLDVQSALAVLAVGGDHPWTSVRAALRFDDGGDALVRAAIDAGVVVQTDDGLQLGHPLHRQAIDRAVDPATMRAAHVAMADALGDDPRATWHLAAATAGSDDEIADRMERMAVHATSHGDLAMAARAYQRSAELSTERHHRFSRLARSGRAWWEASLPLAAIDVLGDLLIEADTPIERADVAGDLGDAIAWRRSVADGVGLLTDAAERVEHDDPGRACGLYLRASLLVGLAADAERHLALAHRAVELAEVDPGPLLVAARLVRGLGAQLVGRRQLADDDLALAGLVLGLPTDQIDSTVAIVLQAVGNAQMVREEHAAAQQTFERVVAVAQHRGQPGVVGFTAACLSELAFRRGRFVDAILTGSRDIRSFEHRPRTGRDRDTGDADSVASFGHAAVSRAAAVTGRSREARIAAEAALAKGDEIGMSGLGAWARSGLGLAHLSDGEVESSVRVLREARLLATGWIDPSLLWHHGDLMEALSLAGHHDEIDAIGTELERRCAATGTRYGAAIAARHRHVSGGRGSRRGGADVDAIRWSIDVFTDLDAPFERARSLAALAHATGADEPAREAAAEFDRLGAVAWAERTRPGRSSPASDPSPWTQLTTAELRVAGAVAEGLANRDVADALFISPKTVEFHLRNIFRKIDVSRRAELVARFHAAGLAG